MKQSPKQSICVWRTDWLPRSEPWIRNQNIHFRLFNVLTLGMSRLKDSLALDSDYILFGDNFLGKIQKLKFKLSTNSRKVDKFIESQNIQAIFSHFLLDATYIRHTASKMNIPLFIYVHGYDVLEYPNRKSISGWIYRRRFKETLQYASKIFCNSLYMRNSVIALGADPKKCVVNYLGVDINTFKPTRGTKIDGIIFAGRLVEQKGCVDLFQAVKLLPGEMSRTRIKVFGLGPELEYLKQLALELNLNVEFFGSVSQSELANHFNTSQLLCGPSKRSSNGSQEPFGMVFVEAAACGLPSVSYELGGIPEAILNSETGILCPENDIHRLSKAIESLLSNHDLRKNFSKKGIFRVSKYFNIAKNTAVLEDVIVRTIRGRI